MDPNNPIEGLNTNVTRGKLLALREIHGLTLDVIQDFYRNQIEEQENL